jgi:chemotaxis signal transduction protein
VHAVLAVGVNKKYRLEKFQIREVFAYKKIYKLPHMAEISMKI